MSHIVKIKAEIKNLTALAEAAKSVGCELRLEQKQFLTYGQRRSKCDAAIVVVGASAQTYEIGVQKRAEGRYELEWDSWNGGYGLVEKVGQEAKLLRQHYTAHAFAHTAHAEGYRVETHKRADNHLVVRAFA